MKRDSWLIGLLMCTAIVMAVLLAMPSGSSNVAQAMMINTQGDFTLVTAGQVGGNELLYVVDNRNGKMLVYQMQNNGPQLLAGGSVAGWFQATGTPK